MPFAVFPADCAAVHRHLTSPTISGISVAVKGGWPHSFCVSRQDLARALLMRLADEDGKVQPTHAAQSGVARVEGSDPRGGDMAVREVGDRGSKCRGNR